MENLSQETIVVIAITSLVAFVVGFFIGRAKKGDDSNTQNAVSAMQKQLDDYKQEVSEHFGKTADLVDNLTQSYKDVFDHLGSSAKTLLTEDQVNKHIASRADKAITLTYSEPSKATDAIDTTKTEEAQTQNTHTSDKEADKVKDEALPAEEKEEKQTIEKSEL